MANKQTLLAYMVIKTNCGHFNLSALWTLNSLHNLKHRNIYYFVMTFAAGKSNFTSSQDFQFSIFKLSQTFHKIPRYINRRILWNFGRFIFGIVKFIFHKFPRFFKISLRSEDCRSFVKWSISQNKYFSRNYFLKKSY